MIIRLPSFNQLGFALSTLYLRMKYMLSYGQVRVIQGDHEITIKCYVESVKLKRVCTLGVKSRIVGSKVKFPRGTYKGAGALSSTSEVV